MICRTQDGLKVRALTCGIVVRTVFQMGSSPRLCEHAMVLPAASGACVETIDIDLLVLGGTSLGYTEVNPLFSFVCLLIVPKYPLC